MKLLFCEHCRGLSIPPSLPSVPSYCRCRQAACWWIDPAGGELGVYAEHGVQSVRVVGLHNGLLVDDMEGGYVDHKTMQTILAQTPASYLFHRVGSLVVCFRPGYTSDTHFHKELP